ncbi:hypothetical protein M3703_00325 [Mannheimia haemolytica]|uniref:hypothetical protein n=1 Tax=Mannheimia haemolytica TaxID=75985 RepID=UPI000DA3C522|nr:hypothetical protein [Mannheimia haemolytica]MEE3730370.1 hypothetical protein [Mannheimia haemolytica]UQX79846.1 hypothetical protein M3703_00325 [Mannheimia haemolytica]SQE30223.1 Uncharacterized protein conserved in bacteria [Mannheimia haemolytica]HDL1260510.1 hypothetical protein [Mannheimia haemolytica]
MKFILFDSILERHLGESLKRALESLGHQAVFTDLILHGHSMISKQADIDFMWKKVKDICDEKADMFISFRPMNLTTEMLEYIGKRMKTAIWLSDDPVLYKTCYSQVVNHYDVLLHCGYKEVMDFYEANNHPKGFNFPFWTDHVAFPSVYNPLHSDYEIAFLGNMNGQVRRKRYMELASLPFTKKVFGLIDSDPLAMHGGFINEAYLHTKRVTEVLSKAKVGVSIPQFFTEYNGLDYDFPELAGLGYFQFPSRVIQYAASGLPIAAVGDERMKEVYPEIFVGNSITELEPYIKQICEDYDFALSESAKILTRFRKNYSALSRAMMLIDLVENLDKLQSQTTQERAILFTKYKAQYN